MDSIGVLISVSLIALVLGSLLVVLPYLTWVERRGMAVIQDRIGPNRVGPFGLLQPIADGVKFLFKESIYLPECNRFLFFLAPALALIIGFSTFAVVPFGGTFSIGGREISLSIADVDIGLLYVIAISSLGVYGILFGGWASNNKFSLMGALRAASQMISYEVVLGLALVSILLIYGTTDLRKIVEMQIGFLEGPLPQWGFFLQPVTAFLFVTTAFAETNRLPFDLPEGESELVAGYHTEYSGLKFASFMLAEYLHMIMASSIFVLLFLGGWNLPGFVLDGSLLTSVLGMGIFGAKVFLVIWLFIWVRFTLPRFRYDQLMRLGWKVLLPFALINVMATAVVVYWKG